jgi:hypothetical protein
MEQVEANAKKAAEQREKEKQEGVVSARKKRLNQREKEKQEGGSLRTKSLSRFGVATRSEYCQHRRRNFSSHDGTPQRQPDGEEFIVRVGKLSLNIHMLNALLCVLGGTLGSSVSALISAADRIARGWEFKDGTKYPKEDPKDKFGARMVPWFIVRPFLGSAMGLLVYVGMKGGYLIAVRNASQGDFSREGLLFLAFLGGLGFAKQKRSN